MFLDNEKIIKIERASYHKFKKNKKFKLYKDYFYFHTKDYRGRYSGCIYYRLNDYELTRDEREKREKELYEILLEVKLITPSKTKKKV